ncbi:hypothetical protein [Allosphingosinicella indica]|uniref:XRE family transcriptional regulator n=1 Tax=Allosphingosinicella indica TaxID=941907 RepID=A0A1X7GIT5_9SPHN|nr:hypothetical protein [Allosphingosinicella indica]SMF70465.1 hypothetical protein SAMN06295910_1870 [Allosphingosinicella indica]
MRRKGERLRPILLDTYGPEHGVARAIRDGDRWFGAWQRQKATPYAMLAKRTGIPLARISALDAGDRISRAELDALAIAWSVSTGDLIASIGESTQIVD